MKSPTQTETVPLRRNKATGQWAIADGDRAYFTDKFASALLRGVRFVHDALPMRCVADYDSTGEAIGVVEEVGATELPKSAIVSLQVAYDQRRGAFIVADQPHVTVESADFLLLLPDGTSVAGWQSVNAAPKTLIRRSKGIRSWCASDSRHAHFIGGFQVGLMERVSFVHRAPPMTCVHGYESTGEAVGIVTKVGEGAKLPPDVRAETVVYVSGQRLFKTLAGNVVSSADYLLLKEDGKAIAGWNQ